MMSRRKAVTAQNLLDQLSHNPRYVKMIEENARERQEREHASRLEQAALTRELEAVGVAVSSVWELVNSPNYYTAALPILIRHLRLPYTAKLREGIARALAVPEARFAWDALLSGYKSLSDQDEHAVKAAIALALSAAATPDVASDLIAEAKDQRNGGSRLMLLSGLRRLSTPATLDAINSLRNDSDLAKEIASWKGRS